MISLLIEGIGRSRLQTSADNSKPDARISGNKKTPLDERGFLYWVPGSVLLSHGECHTTIGATAFHFWVRHGIRWFHGAMAARQILQSEKADVSNEVAYWLVAITEFE